MLDALKDFFFTRMNPQEDDPARAPERSRDIRLAACALLLELAHADDEFSNDERQHLENAIRRHFGLNRKEAEHLLRLAERERRDAADLWQFTNLIRQNYTTGQKMVLAEIMWGVVFSDGELSSREEYLIRKVSGLLGLEMGYLTEARERARNAEPPSPGVD